MSETKHSPEPWVYWDNGFDAGIVSEEDLRHAKAKATHPSIIFGGEPCEGRIEADDPNMRRVLACVNACAGIPMEALESNGLNTALNLLGRYARGDVHVSQQFTDTVLRALAVRDMTDEELQHVTTLSPNAERPRRGELVEMGLVEESGERRPTLSGRAATVWRVTDAGRRMLEPGGAL